MGEEQEAYGHHYRYLGGPEIVREPAISYAPLVSRIQLIRRGLPLHSLRQFLKHSGLTRQELAAILQISPRTIQRYTEGQMLPPAVTEKLLHLNDLYERAAEVLGGGPANVTEWLRSELPALSDQRPLDLLDTYEGLREVAHVLGRLEWGVYS